MKGPSAQDDVQKLADGRLNWSVSRPLLEPVESHTDFYYSVKDPSVVFFGGRWHLFCSVRGRERSHQIEYITFEDWDRLAHARRRMLGLSDGYYCAQQVFFFRPHRNWYLVCQASDESWEPNYQAAYATTSDIGDPDSWSRLQPLGARQADGKSGLDFWIICDEQKAHLFFTTLDGRMWREETPLSNFPHGWSEPRLALRGDVFEASHTYRLQGRGDYLTLIEAQAGGRRYYKAYLADRLDGDWRPLAATRQHPFAGLANTQQAEHWTDSFSHGELLRTGVDERLEVDPTRLRFLFQGVGDAQRAGKKYGEIPWRLGMLRLAP